MSNNSNNEDVDTPAIYPAGPCSANSDLPKTEAPREGTSASFNVNNQPVLLMPAERPNDSQETTREGSASVAPDFRDSREHTRVTNGESSPAVRPSDFERTVREGGPVSSQSSPISANPPVTPRPAPTAMTSNPEGIQAAPVAAGPPATEATHAGGQNPPGLPPAATIAATADEPKPKPKPLPGDGVMPPPLFDVEEFVREAQDRKRGAKTIREIKRLEAQIRVLRQRGLPSGAIHRGLKERNLVTCSRTRFDEICADLFAD